MTPEEETAFRAEIARDARETELEIEHQIRRLDIALDVLAWYLVKRHSPDARPPWPENAIFLCEPLLVWLAFRDPILFEAAKLDAAEIVVTTGIDARDRELATLISKLLTAVPPTLRRKGGDFVGRDVLILVAAEIGADWDSWDANGWRFDRGYSSTSIARQLCDRLNLHPMLANTPDAAPSESTIRAVWDGKGRKVIKLGLSRSHIEQVFDFSARV